MLDPVAIPILTQVLSFLFGEGSKILEERRDRRKAQQEVERPEHQSAPAQPAPTHAANALQSKEAVLNAPLDTTAWRNSEADIKHLMSLLEIYTRNYYLAREQYAKWGSALVPPIIVNNLIEAEDAVRKTMQDLQAILSKVYTQKVTVSAIEQE
jgi:hypothetical protein